MKITIRAGRVAIGVLWLLTAGCSREQQDWRTAEAADTIESYDKFIRRHPESELVTQARARVAQLGEDRDWLHAGGTDTAEAYRQFLAQHPSGKWAQEARIRIDNLALWAQRNEAPTAAAAAVAVPVAPVTARVASAVPAVPGPAAAVPAPRLTIPAPRPTAPPPPGPGAGSRQFAVQLGAFSTEAAARDQWTALAARFGPELSALTPTIVGAETPSGRLYRLQSQVAGEPRARAICEALKQRGQACVAVLPH